MISDILIVILLVVATALLVDAGWRFRSKHPEGAPEPAKRPVRLASVLP